MVAIISSTYDPQYIWNIPLTTYCWNRLGVSVFCFMPDVSKETQENANKYFLSQNTILKKIHLLPMSKKHYRLFLDGIYLYLKEILSNLENGENKLIIGGQLD